MGNGDGNEIDNEKLAAALEARRERANMTSEEYDKRQLERDAEKLGKQEDIIKKLKEIEKLGYARNDIDKREIDNAIEKIRLKEEELRLTTGLSAEQQKAFLLEVDSLEARKEGMDKMEGALQRWLGLTQDGGKMFDNLGNKAMGAAQKFSRMMNPANLAAAGITKVAQATVALALEQDAAAVAFNKATGQAGEYNSQIRGLERSMVNAGVTSAEAGQAFADLFNTVTDFSNMSKGTQMNLAKTVAVLNELGVSSSESAQSIQFLTKVMGQSTDQAAAQTREIFAFAQELGVSAAGMSADFIKMQPQIAALGDTGVQAFKDLQAQAKATGMSFDSLLSITAKFDTFAGAAEQVGKLNAIMGGPFLNTLEMVATTDPAERMRKLSEGINASGLSFDQMSYYQKKAMTSAAGLNSEMELAMLLSGKLETARGPQKTQAQLVDLQEQTTQFNTVMDELKQLAMSLAVSFGPIVNIIKTMVDGLTYMAPLIKVIIAGLGIWALAAGKAAVATAYATGGASALAASAALATVGIGIGSFMVGSAAGGQSPAQFAVGTGGAPGGMALVGERGPEMVSLPKGSQVAANGSAAFNRQTASPAAGGGSTAPSAPPVVNVTVKLGDQELKQLVQSVEVKPYVGGKKSKLYDSMMTGISKEIMKTA